MKFKKHFFQIFIGFLFIFSSLALGVEKIIDYLDCGKTSVCTDTFVIQPQFNDVGYFNEGLAPVKVGDLWGYINRNKFVIEPQYNNARSFHEGLAAVQIGDLWGYINKDRELVIEPKFDSVGSFREGLAHAKQCRSSHDYVTCVVFEQLPPFFSSFIYKLGYINKSGNFDIRLDPKQLDSKKIQLIRDFNEGLAPIKVGDLWGYIDKNPYPTPEKWKGSGLRPAKSLLRRNMNYFIRPQFTDARIFNEGLAPVKVGDLWGYIRKETRNFFIRPKFDAAGNFSEGLAPVKIGNEWGYISKETREFAIELDFNNIDDIGNFIKGLARVKINGQWGYINKAGVFVIPPKFDAAGNFSEGLTPVKVGDLWGYINIKVEQE